MTKFLEYYIQPDQSLIIEILAGNVTLDDYKSLKTNQLLDAQFDPAFNFIVDIRKVEMKFTESLKEKMVDYQRFSADFDALVSK